MSDDTKFRAMDWLIGVATTVALGVGSWSLVATMDHSKRIAVIEDTRFTREDARINREEIIGAVQTPRWIEERFERIADQNDRMLRQLEEIERKLERDSQ